MRNLWDKFISLFVVNYPVNWEPSEQQIANVIANMTQNYEIEFEFKKIESNSIEQLKCMLNLKSMNTNGGICFIFECLRIPCMARLHISLLIVECCKELNIYSDDTRYPISHPLHESKYSFHNINNIWDENTIYGRRRIAVFKLVIKCLEELNK